MPPNERPRRWRHLGALAALGTIGLLPACDRDPIASGACRIEMLDGENLHHTTLQVEEIAELRYTVMDGVDSASPWQVVVTFDEAGSAQFAYASVPAVTRDDLLRDYAMQDDPQLTFLTVPDHPCTDLEKALIYFLVMEWFYFG